MKKFENYCQRIDYYISLGSEGPKVTHPVTVSSYPVLGMKATDKQEDCAPERCSLAARKTPTLTEHDRIEAASAVKKVWALEQNLSLNLRSARH